MHMKCLSKLPENKKKTALVVCSMLIKICVCVISGSILPAVRLQNYFNDIEVVIGQTIRRCVGIRHPHRP